ncbi:MAG: glycosyl-4,4'-diaponeurosporenoate acyltransferase [Chloroflexi bacterium]|jgi:glycosyl-4,4'-diaponeurosporenoate acyltransferase|nr:hypothetical protein [Anaerolineaceae bacterium]NMB88960.1 glycosyl-4,4'-diaponeurosporenoate acyltransferase [Chloroflexota bacterium]
MRIFYFPTFNTILVDVVAWVIIHLSIGYWCSRLPLSWFDPQKWLYQVFPWEKGGEIYQRLFRVRSWKKFIPSGGSLYKDTFSLQRLSSYHIEHLEHWLSESCRAEFCHWVMMAPGLLFFLWNNVELAWGMVVYAVANNIVPIIMQRFNRPRVRRILEHLRKQAVAEPFLYADQNPETAYLNSYC